MDYKKVCLISFALFSTNNLLAADYETPPTISTSSNVPYIADAAMEECVKLYNEAKWLGESINKISVNQYNQGSVDDYNNKINQHSRMTRSFNNDCAGKQSESAYRAAKKLNKR